MDQQGRWRGRCEAVAGSPGQRLVHSGEQAAGGQAAMCRTRMPFPGRPLRPLTGQHPAHLQARGFPVPRRPLKT